MWRKACPRCRGDVFEMWVNGGMGAVCLQCGYELPRQQYEALLRARAEERRKITVDATRVVREGRSRAAH